MSNLSVVAVESADNETTNRAEILAAVNALRAAGLPPSEALQVVRGANRLTGPLMPNVPVALDILAAESAQQATIYHRAAELLRRAGTHVADWPVAA